VNGIALVRQPSPRLAEGLVTHVERRPVNYDRALQQWYAYVDALANADWNVMEVPPADDCPDGVFIEDAVVVFGDLAVVTRPGAEARRPETFAIPGVVSRLGLTVRHIKPPGTLDGGDVLKVGQTAYVGRSERTNDSGIEQLRSILEPLEIRVVTVPLSRVLHLKSAVTALPDSSVIGYPPNVDDASLFPTFREVPEESGAHVVLIGGTQLLMAADAPRTAQMLADRGYEPVTVDISEFEKLEGCVTCLSVRIRSEAQ
jgi:dimethylargininase